MLYVLDEDLAFASASSAEHFVRSALAVVERVERYLAGSLPSQVPQEAEYVHGLANFAAELLACIQLWQWEESGEARYLRTSLPKYADAIEHLKVQIQSAPEWFLRRGPSDSELFELIAAERSRSFRFSPELGAVLLTSGVDESELVETLAQLVVQLWQQRDRVRRDNMLSPIQPHISPMDRLAAIPGLTVTPISTGMNYDVTLV